MTQQNLAIVIGINAYENGISPLKTPVNDAIKVAEVLKTSYRYEIKQLLNCEATLQGINNLLENLKAGTLTLSDGRTVQVTSYQRVLFYFAGHGITEDGFENKDGPAGYLLPQDAQKTDKSTFLPMRKLHDVLVELECLHLLLILDCCFAGAFGFLRNLVPYEKLYRERYDRFMKGKAQQMIASAAYDEKALDVLTRLGQRENQNTKKHSPFAEVLLKGLRGDADIIPDGVITASELYIYLEKELAEVTSRQTPGLYTLKHHEKGEYIFQVPDFIADNLEKAPPLNESTNPYRGLESFNEEHKDLFFGRARIINELYIRSKQKSLMIVTGASGTGKSSLVKAGLVPRLRDDGWYIVNPLRPGKSPFSALGAAILLTVVIREASVVKTSFFKSINQNKYTCNLARKVFIAIANIFVRILEEYNDQKIISSLSEVLQKNPKSLTKLAQISNLDNSAKILLVIDQFEELVTVCSEEEKEKFLEWLEKSLIDNSGMIRVIITLRSDFKAQFSKLFDVKRFIDVAQFTVPIMTQDEFREIIEKPATEKVLYFEPPELVDELINEVVQMPGALPLFSFTLSQLYLRCCDRWQEGETNRAITLEDYKQLDGVMGSLKKTATDVFEKLINEKKATEQTIRHVMLRMVSVSGDELARRRVLVSELEYPEPKNGEAKEVIKAFTDARLLVKGTSSDGEVYVEPAHDALVNGWNQILVWKNQQQENLLLQRGLTPAVIEWRNIEQRRNKVEPLLIFLDKGLDLIDDLWIFSKTQLRLIRQNSQEKKQKSLKKSKFLWDSNPRLNLLKEVLDSNDNWLSKTEAEFVQSSIKQSRRNIARGRSIALGVILVVVVFGIVAWIQRGIAIRRQRVTLAQQIAAQSEAVRTNQPQLSLLLAAESPSVLRDGDPRVPTMEQALYDSLAFIGGRGLQKHSARVIAVALSPDNRWLATGSEDGTVVLWDLEAKDPVKEATVLKASPDWVSVVSFSPNSRWLVTAGGTQMKGFLNSNDRTAILWDLDNKKGSSIPKKVLEGHKGAVSAVAFSPNGLLMATGGGEGFINVWNLNDLSKPTIFLEGHKEMISALNFGLDSHKLATISRDGTAHLWDLNNSQSTKPVKTKEGNSQGITAIGISPNLRWLVVAGGSGSDRYIEIFDLLSTTFPAPIKRLPLTDSPTFGIVFSPDSRWFVTIPTDISEFNSTQFRTARLWDLKNVSSLDQPFAVLPGHQGTIYRATFTPDSKKLVTVGADRNVYLWDLKDTDSITEPIILPAHDDNILAVGVSDNWLATGGADKFYRTNSYLNLCGRRFISLSR